MAGLESIEAQRARVPVFNWGQFDDACVKAWLEFHRSPDSSPESATTTAVASASELACAVVGAPIPPTNSVPRYRRARNTNRAATPYVTYVEIVSDYHHNYTLLHKLPPTLLIKIADLLPVEDLVSLISVSRLLHKFLESWLNSQEAVLSILSKFLYVEPPEGKTLQETICRKMSALVRLIEKATSPCLTEPRSKLRLMWLQSVLDKLHVRYVENENEFPQFKDHLSIASGFMHGLFASSHRRDQEEAVRAFFEAVDVEQILYALKAAMVGVRSYEERCLRYLFRIVFFKLPYLSIAVTLLSADLVPNILTQLFFLIWGPASTEDPDRVLWRMLCTKATLPSFHSFAQNMLFCWERKLFDVGAVIDGFRQAPFLWDDAHIACLCTKLNPAITFSVLTSPERRGAYGFDEFLYRQLLMYTADDSEFMTALFMNSSRTLSEEGCQQLRTMHNECASYSITIEDGVEIRRKKKRTWCIVGGALVGLVVVAWATPKITSWGGALFNAGN